jgi:hypothetical protein
VRIKFLWRILSAIVEIIVFVLCLPMYAIVSVATEEQRQHLAEMTTDRDSEFVQNKSLRQSSQITRSAQAKSLSTYKDAF